MEATLGISLYSYLYLKLAKCYDFFIIFYAFSSTKLENKRAEQVLSGRVGRQERGRGSRRLWEGGRGKVAQTMYTHVSKCKNYKIKKLKIKE
jgi:hypothetical protein